MLNYVLTNSKKRDNMETTGNDFLERIKKIQTPVNDALEKYFNGSLDNSALKLSENEVKKTQQMLNDGGFTDWKGKKLAVDGVRGKRFEDSFNKYMQSTVYDPKVETLQRALNVNGFRDKNGNQLLTDGKYGPKTDSAVMAAAEEYRKLFSNSDDNTSLPDVMRDDELLKNDGDISDITSSETSDDNILSDTNNDANTLNFDDDDRLLHTAGGGKVKIPDDLPKAEIRSAKPSNLEFKPEPVFTDEQVLDFIDLRDINALKAAYKWFDEHGDRLSADWVHKEAANIRSKPAYNKYYGYGDMYEDKYKYSKDFNAEDNVTVGVGLPLTKFDVNYHNMLFDTGGMSAALPPELKGMGPYLEIFLASIENYNPLLEEGDIPVSVTYNKFIDIASKTKRVYYRPSTGAVVEG